MKFILASLVSVVCGQDYSMDGSTSIDSMNYYNLLCASDLEIVQQENDYLLSRELALYTTLKV